MTAPEIWLTGPAPDIPALLQPVAHSLLQSRSELHATLATIAPDDVWVSAMAFVLPLAGRTDDSCVYATRLLGTRIDMGRGQLDERGRDLAAGDAP